MLSDKVKEAFGGDAGMLVVRDNRVGIDFGEFRSFIEDLCHEFGTDAYVLFAGPVPAAKGRKCEEPQYARIEETKESPQTRQMRKENAELRRCGRLPVRSSGLAVPVVCVPPARYRSRCCVRRILRHSEGLLQC